MGTNAARRLDAHGDEPLKIALVGCGRRGTAATVQALGTPGRVQLVAMADAFADRLETSLAQIERKRAGRVDVPPERRFVGIDAYERALDAGADVAILATPPGFRPLHFERAVERGMHAFLEKPVAVDAPGVRRVIAAGERAQKAGLKVGVGLQRRHEPSYVETVERIRGGEIGRVYLLRCYWNGEGVWMREREPGMGELEYQLRNWYYFAWLSGDHLVEQHIHNLDVANWIAGDHPVRAQGQGGRQIRTGSEFGQIYDHHAVQFEYADDTVLVSQCRQQHSTWQSVSEHAHGTLGVADVSAGTIERRDGMRWRFERAPGSGPIDAASPASLEDLAVDLDNPHQLELNALFAAIRSGAEHAEAQRGAVATMTAILGRMASYSGRAISWDEAFASNLALAPDRIEWTSPPPVVPDAAGRYPIPTPGVGRAL